MIRQAFGHFQYPTPPLHFLDTQRIYRDAYATAGGALAVDADAAAEFEGEV
ncbi:hypothetical protein [Streptomyces sp. 11x1]|uniref:hypothetical protein n=1 Tax=Streptomyces sp. 11x1 TaxID=3038642 RepID=UPI00292FC26A|nr:hypothetical protein [Streptomyces sp. 11x1]WNZ12670.1 hypothetical protein P8T65_37265 [Streptomyces sp. 11x1]